MSVAMANDFAKRLAEVLGFPLDDVRSVTLELVAGDAAIVRIERFVGIDAASVFENHRLERIDS